MASNKKLAVITIAIALIAALATVPGVWHYTETNKFCNDCHKNMEPGYSTQQALDAGLAKPHYQQHFHGKEKNVTCEECHKGPGLSGMIKAKVIQATNEVYQYFVLGDRTFPPSVEYPDKNCMKTECHPQPKTQHNVSIKDKDCINCHSGHHNIHKLAKKQTITKTKLLDCQRCHQQKAVALHKQHQTSQNCLECHNKTITRLHKHYANTTNISNCRTCHKEHPYPTKLGSKVCKSCHQEAPQQIRGSPHDQKSCIRCHNSSDKFANCSTCHGHPHGNISMSCPSCHEQGGHEPSQIKNFMITSNCKNCHNTTFSGDFAIHQQRLVCTNCHTEHFKTKNCTSCHRFPDHPKDLNIEGDCTNCHGTMTSKLVRGP